MESYLYDNIAKLGIKKFRKIVLTKKYNMVNLIVGGQNNMTTKEYRKTELKKVNTQYRQYKPKIKIIKPNGETNWLDIEEEELEKIKTILTK